MALNYPMPISPLSNGVLDPAIANTFSCKVQGSSVCNAYKLMIYDIDNNPVYTGTKISLSTPLYNNEELDITTSANFTNCVVSNPYKYAVTMYFADELSKSLVNNGYFYSGLSNWTYGTNWSYSTAKTLCTAGLTTAIYQNISVSSNKVYRLSVTATVTAGTLIATFGTSTGSLSITSSGAFTCDYTTTTSTNALTFTPNATFAGSIDNIKLQLVNNNVTSQETLFWAYTTPTLSINMPSTSPYNLQYYTFTLNYTQAEGVKLKEFSYTLYNSNQEVIGTKSSIGTSKTDYYVDGLASGETYYIQATATNQMGVSLTSDMMSFTVSYSAAKLVLTPTVVNNVEYNSLDVSWVASQITGIPSDLSKIQYVPSFIYTTNTGLHINSGATVTFSEIVAPTNFTYIHEFGLDNGITGSLVSFTDEISNVFLLTYDGTNLVYSKNGTTLTTYNISSYGVNYWFIVMQPTSMILERFIATNEIYPKDTVYPSDTLYPLVLEDS